MSKSLFYTRRYPLDLYKFVNVMICMFINKQNWQARISECQAEV